MTIDNDTQLPVVRTVEEILDAYRSDTPDADSAVLIVEMKALIGQIAKYHRSNQHDALVGAANRLGRYADQLERLAKALAVK